MKFFKQPAVLSTSAASLLPDRNDLLCSRWRHAARFGVVAAAVAGLLDTGTSALHAADFTWNGGGANNEWNTATNWTPNGTPGTATEDNITFGPVAAKTSSNLSYLTTKGINSITFSAGAPSYFISGTAGAELLLDVGGITNNSTSTQTISIPDLAPGFGGIYLFNFGGAAKTTETWTAAAGNIVINSNVTFGGITSLILTGSKNIIINGAINDSGTPQTAQLIKTGTGTAFLNGQNTYLGNTTVSGGVLQVNGSIASLQTYLTPGGTLAGTGIIGGTVNNSGNVSAGNSPNAAYGKLSVNGSYNQSAAGQLTVNVSGNSSNLLAVQGQANLNGALRIVQLGNAPRLSVGQQITFLTAAGGVNGRFSSVSDGLTSDTIVTTGVIYHGNSVAIEGEQGSFKTFAQATGLTPNQVAVAGGLDHVAFRNQETRLISYLDSEPLSKLPDDFEKISPDQLTSIFTLGVSLANVQTANLQRRTDDIRTGSNGFSAAGFQTAGSGPLYSGTWGAAGPTGDDGKESKEVKNVVAPEDRWGVFITGIGEWVNVNGDGNGRNYDLTTGGFTLGADYKVTPNFAIGIDAGYTGTASDIANGGRIFVNGGKLGLYSTFFTGGFYVDTAVNGGYNSYDTTRSSLQGTARGETDGGELNALFGTGYDFKINAWTIGPTASFQYSDIGVSGFGERDSLAPLTFRAQSQDSLRTAVGFKTSYDWKLGGIVIKPELRAAWQHEFGDDSYELDSSFTNGDGSLFSVNGPRIGRDSLLLGAGFAILWNERTSTYVYYDGELARTNYDSQNVSAGMRISF